MYQFISLQTTLIKKRVQEQTRLLSLAPLKHVERIKGMHYKLNEELLH